MLNRALCQGSVQTQSAAPRHAPVGGDVYGCEGEGRGAFVFLCILQGVCASRTKDHITISAQCVLFTFALTCSFSVVTVKFGAWCIFAQSESNQTIGLLLLPREKTFSTRRFWPSVSQL